MKSELCHTVSSVDNISRTTFIIQFHSPLFTQQFAVIFHSTRSEQFFNSMNMEMFFLLFLFVETRVFNFHTSCIYWRTYVASLNSNAHIRACLLNYFPSHSHLISLMWALKALLGLSRNDRGFEIASHSLTRKRNFRTSFKLLRTDSDRAWKVFLNIQQSVFPFLSPIIRFPKLFLIFSFDFPSIYPHLKQYFLSIQQFKFSL